MERDILIKVLLVKQICFNNVSDAFTSVFHTQNTHTTPLLSAASIEIAKSISWMLNDILVIPKEHDKHLKIDEHDSEVGKDEDAIKIRIFLYKKKQEADL